MLEYRVSAGGRAGEGAALKHTPSASRLGELWELEKSLWRRYQGLEDSKDCSWYIGLRKSFQAGEKAWRWESGREIFREAFDLAGGEECSLYSDC